MMQRKFWFALWSCYAGMALGFSAWALSGVPALLLPSFMCGGIACFCTTTAFVLWRKRCTKASTVSDPPSSDRPGTALPPGTAAERSIDLRAYRDGHISLEEYLDRWAGRKILDPREVFRQRVAEAIKEELSKSSEPSGTYPCTNCLGLHHQVGFDCQSQEDSSGNGIYRYTVLPQEVGDFRVSPLRSKTYRPGDMVRLRHSGYALHARTLREIVRIDNLDEGPLWGFQEPDSLYPESAFEFLAPKIGEEWEYDTCDSCERVWETMWEQKRFFVDYDWPITELKTRCRVTCGCLHPYERKIEAGRVG